jgi:hypothetical protein
MGTSEKLTIAKEMLATSFMLATENSMVQGLQYAYKSYPVDQDNEDGTSYKAWHMDIIVKELGYGEKTIQQLRFLRPNNIDAKNMEYHVIIETMAAMTQGALTMWYEVGKMLASDKELQKEIRDDATKSDFTTDEPEQSL